MHLLLLVLIAVLAQSPLGAAELRPATVAAFDRYVRLTETAPTRDSPFLWVDRLPPALRRTRHAALRRGEVVIERLITGETGPPIEIPGGMIHHWTGTVFVPGVTVEQTLRVLQDYDHHDRIYAPTIQRSRVLASNGDEYRIHLRFALTRVITVIVNSEHEARFTREGPNRVRSVVRSTRIAEVADAGTPGEHEHPVGRGEGFLWRLNSYWRIAGGGDGVYVECESITLSRAIPTGLGWLLGPYVRSIPEEALTFTLERTRSALNGAPGSGDAYDSAPVRPAQEGAGH